LEGFDVLPTIEPFERDNCDTGFVENGVRTEMLSEIPNEPHVFAFDKHDHMGPEGSRETQIELGPERLAKLKQQVGIWRTLSLTTITSDPNDRVLPGFRKHLGRMGCCDDLTLNAVEDANKTTLHIRMKEKIRLVEYDHPAVSQAKQVKQQL
jgi:hypothetical protein